MENLAGLDEQVRTALRVLDGRPVHVGPVTLASIHGPWPGGSAALGLPAQVDPRQPSLFAAAWTVGALGGLLGSGAATITLFETAGWRGLMERADGSAAPGRFLSEPGALFPVWRVLADVAEHAVGHVRSVKVPDGGRVAAFGISSADGTTIDVANLTREQVDVRLSLPADVAGPGEMHILDATTTAVAMMDLDRSGSVGVAAGAPIRLGADAVARVRLPAGRS
jgi:hypothetical protein